MVLDFTEQSRETLRHMRMTEMSRCVRQSVQPGVTQDQLKQEIRRSLRERRRKRAVFGFCIILLVALATGMLMAQFSVQLVTVRDTGACSEIPAGSLVLFVKTDAEHVQAGDWVLFRYDGRPMIWRVLGIPGDRIRVYEDGRVVRLNAAIAGEETTDIQYVPENSLYVLADSPALPDSRNASMGMIRAGWVEGRQLAVIWPVFRWTGLHGT